MNIIRKQQLLERVGLSYVTVWRLMGRGQFPKSIQLTGSRSVGWREEEVQQWIDNRPRTGDAVRKVGGN